jgi:hypothetical protein
MVDLGMGQWNICISVFFTSEILLDGDFFFKNANFGDFFSKTHFLIAKFFIQFDHFLSI